MFLAGSEKEIEIQSLGWGVGFQCMIAAFPYLEKGEGPRGLSFTEESHGFSF